MNSFCCEDGRRRLVRDHPVLNGIDHLEVVDREESDPDLRQRVLRVFFIKPLDEHSGDAVRNRFGDNVEGNAALVKITGGSRFQRIQVTAATKRTDHLEVLVNPRGDYSRYTLKLIEPGTEKPLIELDPVLAAIDFSFKVECERKSDCAPACDCPVPTPSAPALDYLAKDYSSFRQLMLDRMSVVAPEWRERNPADVGIALVELMAFLGDQLSYRQDAIATEAYLGTARSRISLRRHVRMLDYPMHDGCNARTWIQIRLKPGAPDGLVIASPDGVTARPRLVTRLKDGPVLSLAEQERLAGELPMEGFEPLEYPPLFPAHNQLPFHTWGDAACVLPRGATRATLRGRFPGLRPGLVLVFAERIGPKTGEAADADRGNRQAVRLTKVNGLDAAAHAAAQSAGTLPQIVDPVFEPPLPITEIEWDPTDALLFPFCLSSRAAADGRLLTDVSVALGNIVLADHGMTRPVAEDLGQVPAPDPVLALAGVAGCGRCDEPHSPAIPIRFYPTLKEGPLTRAAQHDPSRPAREADSRDFRLVLPSIQLTDDQGRVWRPRHDLLSSDAFAPEFVVETDHSGRAHLRFGDDENGMSPGEGTRFQAVYRVGNGAAGNLGAESLEQLAADWILVPDAAGRLVPQDPANFILEVSNPIAAWGGTEPESAEEIRQNAPAAFRVQERAVTPADYAEKAARHPEVQRAAARLRWTGSWHTVYLTVDRKGGRPVDEAFEKDLRRFLERYRMAGQDLEIDAPHLVPLELEIQVCVAPDFFREHVVAELSSVFSSRSHPDGSRGFFHPDHFTFGQPVLLSALYAKAQAVAGVRHIDVSVLRRQGSLVDEVVPADDVFEVGALEIIQLENDPNYPDRGELRIVANGGR